ncbi:hypothetical protein [Piscinibacter sp.]|uniref:hypothetical protein n=1 Tax=Piscinibacter sp. TaxID=1903157 RepID=UPI002B573AAB|nr:hypothetical protein [Albitalea sp.]HUG21447.1 hypothetical protein [Albitalea sp.]
MKSFWILLLASGSAAADDAAWLRCRAVADASSRLACYDAVTPAANTAKPGQGDPRPGTSAGQPQQPAEQFGLETRSRGPAPDEIASRSPGRFDGWGPRSVIKLANGQSWQVSDGSTGVYRLDSPKVKVTRGMLGAFFLEIEGINRSPKVRRLE